MGVIYKLRPQIKEYIIAQKKNEPILSCRGLMALVESKFQVRISKSSINTLIKGAGLSMPVGRRMKKRRRKPQIPLPLLLETEVKKLIAGPAQGPVEKLIEEVPAEIETAELPLEMVSNGAILLKAADYLVGGSLQIAEAIKNQFNLKEKNLLTLTESLIYISLFDTGKEQDLRELWSLLNKKIAPETILRYLNELQEIKQLPLDIFGIIPPLFQGVRGVKVDLSDESVFYLDSQLRTVWSTPRIPADFSTTIYNIKSYINKYFRENKPFVFFSAPGYDIPSKEFFDFILSLEGREKKISKLTLYDHKFKEIESIFVDQRERYSFVFGLWPWQFGQYRRVKLMGETRQFSFEPLKKDFYLTEAEVELTQPVTNKRVTLKGCVLKTNPDDKIRLIILTNLPRAEEIEELARIYLSRWPNLEDGFLWFSRQIELFTYTALSRQTFSIPQPALAPETAHIKQALANYLNALDAYVRWHFLPSEYKERDFSTVNARFYSLKARLKKQKDYILVTFKSLPGYPFLKDLEYTCRRVNEKEIVLADKKRLWCSIA